MQVDHTVTILLDADEDFPVERQGRTHQVAHVRYDSRAAGPPLTLHDRAGRLVGTATLDDMWGRDDFPYDVRRAMQDAVSGPPTAAG